MMQQTRRTFSSSSGANAGSLVILNAIRAMATRQDAWSSSEREESAASASSTCGWLGGGGIEVKQEAARAYDELRADHEWRKDEREK